MRRFYVLPENIKGKFAYLDKRESHHLINVLRIQPVDKIILFDGTGREYTGFLKNTKNNTAIIEVVKTTKATSDKRAVITLAQAIPKKGKMDIIVEKATELGADCIIPIITKRTVMRIGREKSEYKIEHWKKIAVNTCKQCGRVELPSIEGIRKFEDVINEISFYDLALVATLTHKGISFEKALNGFEHGRIIIFIGPEGDFTPDEVAMAEYERCRLISLGNLTLKSDTAAIAALSILNYVLFR